MGIRLHQQPAYRQANPTELLTNKGNDMKTKPMPLPVFAMNSRVDTVVANIHRAYKADSSFFKANAERRMNVRLRLSSETYSDIDIQSVLRMPSVWMLVHRHGTGDT